MFSLSYGLSLLGFASLISAAPSVISVLSNTKGFTLPLITTSAGGKATCISGNVAIQASAANTNLKIGSPSSQFASTEIFVEYFQANSGTAAAANGGTTTVSGTYNINAKLCFPTSAKTTTNFPTVQFLIHGINFDKLYWDIQGQSYLDAAASAGYATFSYDRLGVGSSDHPDPIQTVQSAIQVEIAHQMISKLRTGAIGGNSFTNVIGIGHSYGSIQSIGLANSYPSDLDAIILQGFTVATGNLPATIDAFNPTIASVDAPLRFGTLPNGYQVVGSAVGDGTTFYRYPNFDTVLFTALDVLKQTFTLGEFFTLTAPVAPASSYKGSVYVVNGENDFIFCSSDCTTGGDLGAAVLAELFPAAGGNSGTYIAPGTGHAINAHNTTSGTYAAMTTFIKKAGF